MGGGDKSLLPLAGRPMLAYVVERLAPQVDRLALSANGDPTRFADFGLPVLSDTVPGQPGPLAGILAGMDWAAALGAEILVTAPGDAPFLPSQMVASLRTAAQSQGLPAAVAATPGPDGPELHPISALWPVAWRGDLRAALNHGARKVRAWVEPRGCALALFDADGFRNINTPADLAAAKAALAGSG
jgi:molybdopterin-guanine dinucleotide biosynthesis protein A